MNLTERDRKIMIIIAPLVLVLAYWFLVLSPQRKESATAAQTLTKQEKRRDAAQANLEQLQRSKSSFGSDYAQLVKLGKAIPSSVDMPTLIVQLDSAAKGTGIKFSKIAAGQPLERARLPRRRPRAAPVAVPRPGPARRRRTLPAALRPRTTPRRARSRRRRRAARPRPTRRPPAPRRAAACRSAAARRAAAARARRLARVARAWTACRSSSSSAAASSTSPTSSTA